MDLLLVLDRSAARSLRDQVYDGLREAIADGRLAPGARLPATRPLAGQLGVSRFTVEDVFARLIADGYAVGRQGDGTYVSDAAGPAPGARAQAPQPGEVPTEAMRRRWSSWRRALDVDGVTGAPVDSRAFDFRHGMPALDAVPLATWRRLWQRVSRVTPSADLHYGPPAGYPVLREAIAAYLSRSRGIRADPTQVVITSGTQQGLDLLARLWLDPGDSVAFEEPGYPAARRVFAATGAAVCPVPVDRDGLRVDWLSTTAPAAKLVYVTPSHQYPTGAVLPLARRRALLGWAAARGALIVEDDYDGEFRYGARPVEALAGLDRGAGVVAYVGTFSKTLFPALRLGYVALPPDMVPSFVAARAVADRHPPTLEQATLAAFIAEGHFERHLARMRRRYAARRTALLDALATHLRGMVDLDPAETAAGLHLLVEFDLPLTESDLLARAAAVDVLLDPAGACYLGAPPAKPRVLLGYAAMSEDRIVEGIRRLAGALAAPVAGQSRAPGANQSVRSRANSSKAAT